MKWNEIRDNYNNKWVLIEMLKANSVSGKRIIEDMSVIGAYENGNEALKNYSIRHKADKTKEMYVYNTSKEVLDIDERLWIRDKWNIRH
ncbi:hypothetical protein [uncultured Clostridium sp.]|jgi:hypothetical protein|uniref:hypothetical protein n=1 Tax=uncultured Clostridium sp. TaxID=59620 RepID=UPI00262EAB90|nr:hypothetical protein [uncultured Clostridium sp.]